MNWLDRAFEKMREHELAEFTEAVAASIAEHWSKCHHFTVCVPENFPFRVDIAVEHLRQQFPGVTFQGKGDYIKVTT